MPADDFIRHGQESTVWAVTAFDPGLLTNPPDPLIAAGRSVTGATGFLALETPWIDILSSPEKRTE
jgi:hypothetical protein